MFKLAYRFKQIFAQYRYLRALLFAFVPLFSIGYGGELHGTVESSTGVSISGASVALIKAGRESRAEYSTTTKDGTFQIVGVKSGLYWMQVSSRGYYSLITGPITIVTGVKSTMGAILVPAGPFDITISDVSTISGVVLSKSGPLEGVRVCTQKRGNSTGPRACTLTDHFGFYGLLAAVGDWRLSAEDSGRAIWQADVELKNEGNVIKHIIIEGER